MNKITTEEQDKFLEELTTLSRKHGIVVGGCGCCGSPFLETISQEKANWAYFQGIQKVEWEEPAEIQARKALWEKEGLKP